MPEIQAPPLAVYKSIADYVPAYADFIIWAGWLRTWYGIVLDYNAENQSIAIAFEGTPRLLFTMQDEEIHANVITISLPDVRRRKFLKGCWYAQQSNNGQNVWYI